MNAAVNAFFLIFKLFSLYFLVVSLFCLCRRKKFVDCTAKRRFAVLIAARNEERCIAGLIESLRAQQYPRELFDIWVLPNNCTDHTAEAAQCAGAEVMEMPSSVRSKGAALQYAANALLHDSRHYDAFCVFDADNEADSAFLDEMNQALTPFFTLAAFLAGGISLQSLPVSLISAYAGSLAVAAAALALEKRLDVQLTGGILLYPVFMACFLPLQTLALFKAQTVWHEIRHSGVRLASELSLRREKIA